MTTDRRHEVDAIRSFALLGICIVNLPFLAQPIGVLLAPPPTPADAIARVVIEALFQGKFFVLFSFLFGWGFGVQLDSPARHGAAAWTRYRARLIGLFLFGMAHAVFVFGGDILTLYAVLGLVLWPLRNWPVRRLLRMALAVQALSVLTLLALAILLGTLMKAPQPPLSPGYLGGFWDATAARLRELPLAVTVVALFNGPAALAAFCAGLAAHRAGLFTPGSGAFVALRRWLPLLLALGVAFNGIYVLALNGLLGEGLAALFGFAALAVGGPALAAVYLVAVVALVRAGRVPAALAAVGRMSLTAYVLQGIVAGLIFYGYGLGLHGQIGSAAALPLAVVVFAAVHTLCIGWQRLARIGPLEWLLRRFMDLLSPAPAAARG